LSERSTRGETASQPTDQEIALRVASNRRVSNMTALGCLGIVAYVAATPQGPHRAVIVAIAVFGVVAGITLRLLLPAEKISRGKLREPLLLFWNFLLISGIGAMTMLDGEQPADDPLRHPAAAGRALLPPVRDARGRIHGCIDLPRSRVPLRGRAQL
jgi:hypothetical protein